MTLLTLYEVCVTWVSRGPVNACIDWAWVAEWVPLSI
jgi:hypothetical protein